MTILLYTVVTLLVTLALFLVLLVLIQKGRGGGLSSAFGGVGGHTAFGSKTGDVLTWATAIVFFVFLVLSVVAGLTFEKVNAQRRGAAAAVVAPTTPPPRTQDEGPKTVPNQVPPAAPDPGAAGTPTPTTR